MLTTFDNHPHVLRAKVRATMLVQLYILFSPCAMMHVGGWAGDGGEVINFAVAAQGL